MTFDTSKIDLSWVEPGLRAQTLHRIKVIERYLADPQRGAAARAGIELGLTKHQMHWLARAWTSRRRAEDVTLRQTTRSSPTRPPEGMPDIVRTAVRSAPVAKPIVLIESIAAAALAKGIALPSKPTLRRYIVAEQRALASSAMTTDIAVDIVVIDLPVDNDGENDPATIRPHAIVVGDRDAGAVVNAVLTLDAPCAPDLAKAILAVLLDSSGGFFPTDRATIEAQRAKMIELPRLEASECDEIAAALCRAGFDVKWRDGGPRAHGRVTRALSGDTLAGYSIRTQLAFSERARRGIQSKRISSVPIAVAEDYVRRKIRNSAPTADPFADLAITSMTRLAADLSAIATRPFTVPKSLPAE
jgi:hypothetical protein